MKTKNGGRAGAAIIGLAFAALVGVIATAGGGAPAPAAAASEVPGIPNCGGNSQVRMIGPEGWTCGNTKDFTVKGVSFTVTAVTRFNYDTSATTVFTLSRRLPQAVPVRARIYDGYSSGGVLVGDVQGEIPAGQLTTTLNFTWACGQHDIKAVFTAPGDGRGRISGPYVCRTENVPTTTTGVPTTVPVSVGPTTVPGETTVVTVPVDFGPSATLTATR